MTRVIALAMVVAAAGWLSGAGLAQEAAPEGWAPAKPQLADPLEGKFYSAESTLKDQTDVAVTVYNNDLALVRDRRKAVLYPGEVMLRFADVAERIKPETVSLRSLTEPAALHILEQNYEYDLMSPSKLMEKYVGETVRLVNFDRKVGFTDKEATLLSVNEGPVYQAGGEIYLGHPGNVVLPRVPENLIARPSLVWLLHNTGGDHEIEATYLTQGMQWQADYVVTFDEAVMKLGIEGWVTLNNRSGAAYRNAQMKVVAGGVNIVRPVVRREKMRLGVEMDMKANGAMPMQEETFAEYHLYTLPRRTTIKENESKQVTLLTADGIGAEKIYEYRGRAEFYSSRIPPQKEEPVGVFLKFANKEANRLGMPLPEGVMRVYQRDADGALQFAGEDRIKHTPKDEDVKLRLGSAFDIVGERTQTDYRRLGDRVFESAYEIKLRNHKKTAVRVDIVEPMPDDWTILNSSHSYTKKDARTAVFGVDVPVDGEVVVTYRVRVKH